MSSSERSIPHLRDIFGLNSYTAPHHVAQNGIGYSNSGGNYSGSGGGIDTLSHQSPQLQQMDAKKQSRKKRDNSKTLTTGDVKTLERHLSMKKTIRKKIMRDLQQAFVDDPNEFKVDTTNSEHLKAEINLDALRFGEHPNKKSDNFLVMLRGEQKSYEQQQQYNHSNTAAVRDYDYDTPKEEKQSFWKRFTMKNKTKR